MSFVNCSHCGKQVSDKDTTCPHCNAPLRGNQNSGHQSINVNVVTQESNGIGVAGLVIAILGLFLGWIPILGWIILFLGVLFSFIGVFKAPRGAAIAGLIISFIEIIIIWFFVGELWAAVFKFIVFFLFKEYNL